MALLLTAAQQDVYGVDGMFGLVDEVCDSKALPDRLLGSDWVLAGSASVFLEPADGLIIQARLRTEVWDGPAEINDAYWLDQVCLSMDLTTAHFVIDQGDAGSDKGPQLPAPGRWRLRVGRREKPDDLPWGATGCDLVEVCFLLQFWPAATA